MAAHHDNDTKAAVMAALLAGQRVGEVAEAYKVPPSTIVRWKSEIPPSKLAEMQANQGEEFDQLIFAYLRETLKTLAIQVRFFGDTTWLAKQKASELAVLHGVAADKAILLLEAFGKAENAAESTDSAD